MCVSTLEGRPSKLIYQVSHCFAPLSCFHPQQKAKNEELIQLAEQRKREAEQKRREMEEKENAALRRHYERERQAREEEVSSRTPRSL